MDTSSEFNEYQVNFFHSLIGVLLWIIDLGRIYIAFKVPILSKISVNLKTGHLIQSLYMFKYLEIHNQNYLTFDPCYQYVTYDQDSEAKIKFMKDLYVDAAN